EPYACREIVGQGRALEIILTGRKVPAEECLTIGLCEYAPPLGVTRAKAEELAREIARFPQVCVRADRRLAYAEPVTLDGGPAASPARRSPAPVVDVSSRCCRSSGSPAKSCTTASRSSRAGRSSAPRSASPAREP